MWIQKGKPALLLAPMEGVTDAPMRALLTELPGFTFCVTEFLRISQMELPKKCFHRHCVELKQQSKTPSGTPVIFQLLGGNPELMALSALRAVEVGAKAIDINFGCPAPTVNRSDGGATLLQYPKRMEAIVSAVRNSLPSYIPVSAKLRLGWNSIDSIYKNAEHIVLGGASWITIHGRTKTQGYAPPAYWEPIGTLQKNLPIPVIANGEIFTMEDFHRCQEITQCEHFMIGRGALANPFLSGQIANHLGLNDQNWPMSPSSDEWHKLLFRFIEISEPLSNNIHYTVKRLKQWLKYAAWKGNFIDFDKVKRLETIEQFKQIIPTLEFQSNTQKKSSSPFDGKMHSTFV